MSLPMSSDDTVISVRNLTKTYRMFSHPGDRLKQAMTFGSCKYHTAFTALDHVSFDVTRGETIGVIGRNGSGKSTLLQIVCGVLKPTLGVVHTQGKLAALLELGAGFNPEFTGRENIYFQAALMGLSEHEINDRFDRIVEFADIGDFLDRQVRTYSSGMFVRLAFSVNAHMDSDILIIDEALSVGDVAFVRKCLKYLRDFTKHGTVLLVSHDLPTLVELCQRLIWIDAGKILKIGPSDEVADHYLKEVTSTVGVSGEKVSSALHKRQSLSRRMSSKRDMRLDFLTGTNLRNDIEVAQYPGATAGFGTGEARITEVELCDNRGQPLVAIVGGEIAVLKIVCYSEVVIRQALVGFFVKDENDMALFGDNTFITYLGQDKRIEEKTEFTAVFKFRMPILPVGNYSLTVALADGTQSAHVQHHWVSGALLFHSVTSSTATGLVGVPMEHVEITFTND
jgi:lipopolysaccharide transport system ATP-binding protein